MHRGVMRCVCPHCRQRVVQVVDASGTNVCPHCYRFFRVSTRGKMPFWVWGVLALLVGTLLTRV
jgi:hypothetical protein